MDKSKMSLKEWMKANPVMAAEHGFFDDISPETLDHNKLSLQWPVKLRELALLEILNTLDQMHPAELELLETRIRILKTMRSIGL